MTDTTNGYRALPWRSEGYRVFDADGIEVANTFTPELALGSAKAVAKDIAKDMNAYYGGKDRIAELEQQLSEVNRNAKWMADANQRFEVRIWEEQKRAEKAEARVRALEVDVEELTGDRDNTNDRANREAYRALKAEARVKELEEKLERATWKYGVLDYDRRMDLAKAGAGSAAFLDDEYDDYPVSTFTAPDGRVFRVGQRVWHIWDEPGEFGHVTDINGGFPFVQFRDANDQTHPDNLRRVWDGLEEPDVPVGTVLRDSYGCYLERLSGTRWELRDDKGDLVDNDEWVNLDGEQFRPYVEVLEGDK